MGQTSSNGYADVLVQAKIKRDGNTKNSRVIPDKIEKSLLRYDGKQYQRDKNTPWWLEHFGNTF